MARPVHLSPSQLPPAVVVPVSVLVQCPCGQLATWPSAAVGLTMPCRCGRRLLVALSGPDGRTCDYCGVPLAPDVTRRTRFCSDKCRSEVRNDRRRAAATRAG